MMRITAQLNGMGKGGLFLSLFGGVWMLFALDASSWIWLVTCVLLPTSLLAMRSVGLLLAGRQAQALEPPPAGDELAWERRRSRRFAAVVLVEFGLIALAANLLAHSGHADWIMVAVAAIVAAHFMPLARIFHYPLYYWLGGIELAACAAVAFSLRAHLAAGDVLLGLVMALSLWSAAVIGLLRANRLVAGVRAAAAAKSA